MFLDESCLAKPDRGKVVRDHKTSMGEFSGWTKDIWR